MRSFEASFESGEMAVVDYIVHSLSVAAGVVRVVSDSPAVGHSSVLAMIYSIMIEVEPIIAY